MPPLNKQKHVLVVDDDTDAQALIRFALVKPGCLVSLVSNGEEALKFLSANNLPDMIILDLMMPIMDGFQFREKQLNDDSLKNIPVLLYSIHDNLRSVAKNLGCNGFLNKGDSINQLSDEVFRILSIKKLS